MGKAPVSSAAQQRTGVIFLVPEVVSELVEEGKATLELIQTPSVWYGVTYKEDKPSVVNALKKFTDEGLYKKGLY